MSETTVGIGEGRNLGPGSGQCVRYQVSLSRNTYRDTIDHLERSVFKCLIYSVLYIVKSDYIVSYLYTNS